MTKSRKASELATAVVYGEMAVEALPTRALVEVALGLTPLEAEALLVQIQGNVGNDLARLSGFSAKQLQAMNLTPERALKLRAVVEMGRRVFAPHAEVKTVLDDPSVLGAAVNSLIGWSAVEQFVVVSVDIKHHIIGMESISTGTCNETLANPREIFQSAIRMGAARIAIAHNHPSGSLEPSTEDLQLTRQILQAAKIMGIPVLDHVIVSKGEYSSLREKTMIWTELPQG